MKIAEKTAREFLEERQMRLEERQEISDAFWRRIGEWLKDENRPWPGIQLLNSRGDIP